MVANRTASSGFSARIRTARQRGHERALKNKIQAADNSNDVVPRVSLLG